MITGKKEAFYKSVFRIALPVTLQSLLQSSFSVVDQVMIGRLGSESIAGIGLGGKFSSLYSLVLSAVAAAAGIMISQYIGKKDEREVGRSFFANLFLAMVLAVGFTLVCILFPGSVMGIYTKDEGTRYLAAGYLSVLAFAYLPMAVSTLAATLMRCMEAAIFPLYAGIMAVILNTGLNYLLIFGKCGLPGMGVKGAALATVISQWAVCIITLLFLAAHLKKKNAGLVCLWRFEGKGKKQYLGILGPILVCEFLWSLGENVYAVIYGNMGTAACAAMTLTVPIQTLMTGALSGLAQAAGILIGKSLGSREYDRAYRDSKRLMLYGLVGSLILTVFLGSVRNIYLGIYQVEADVHAMADQLLLVYAVIAPVKIGNMILGGGIIRSGGKTKYVMWIDLIGTWLFGVPLGMLSAFLWNLSIPRVYFLLSLEECVRLGISLVIFKKRIWMKRLE